MNQNWTPKEGDLVRDKATGECKTVHFDYFSPDEAIWDLNVEGGWDIIDCITKKPEELELLLPAEKIKELPPYKEQ